MPGNRLAYVVRAVRKAIPTALLLSLCIGGYFTILQLTGNFHPVVPRELYRSAQLSAEALARYQIKYGIRTVVNLRGANPGRDWYDAEMTASERMGMRHIDFRMSASRELSSSEARALVETFRYAPKPILVHCQAGADRSGLAAALYLGAVTRRGRAASEGQLSLAYGHISLPWLSAYAMDRTLEALRPWE
ncbi:tyrosine-protein phosphatase [Azorhizobium doebereinerae]|uniref:tyrosine-protein phosphatase n=1 Tax=Azorhizobium doebereinerae TaxID=281091 RepID=UPI00055309ED|nr:tyrosine-protein phosphatase [Azorhizobium doebereinerae]